MNGLQLWLPWSWVLDSRGRREEREINTNDCEHGEKEPRIDECGVLEPEDSLPGTIAQKKAASIATSNRNLGLACSLDSCSALPERAVAGRPASPTGTAISLTINSTMSSSVSSPPLLRSLQIATDTVNGPSHVPPREKNKPKSVAFIRKAQNVG